MKTFIVASCIFAVVAATGYNGPYHLPTIDANGFAVDIPEVAQARAAHLTEFAKANSREQYSGSGHYNVPAYSGHYNAPAAPVYTGHYNAPVHHSAPVAYNGPQQPAYIPSYDNNGYQQDTPEVAHAKAAHLTELAKANAKEQHNGQYAPAPYSYSAPAPYAYSAPAPTGYGHPGPVNAPVDTPEVAHAKAAHYAAHAQVLARSGPQHHY